MKTNLHKEGCTQENWRTRGDCLGELEVQSISPTLSLLAHAVIMVFSLHPHIRGRGEHSGTSPPVWRTAVLFGGVLRTPVLSCKESCLLSNLPCIDILSRVPPRGHSRQSGGGGLLWLTEEPLFHKSTGSAFGRARRSTCRPRSGGHSPLLGCENCTCYWAPRGPKA